MILWMLCCKELAVGCEHGGYNYVVLRANTYALALYAHSTNTTAGSFVIAPK